MSKKIILTTRAIKIEQSKPAIIDTKFRDPDDGQLKIKRSFAKGGVKYWIFTCPKCGQRQRRNEHDGKDVKEEVRNFTCNQFGCGISVDVSAPFGKRLLLR